VSPTFKKPIIVTLVLLAATGLFVVYYKFNPSQGSIFLSCPWRLATGYHCPGCGSQRAIHQLLHLNVIAAFRLNPFMVLSLPLILYALGLRLWNYLYNTQYRIALFYKKWFIFGYFGLAILYWVLRNLPYYPFNLLAPTE